MNGKQGMYNRIRKIRNAVEKNLLNTVADFKVLAFVKSEMATGLKENRVLISFNTPVRYHT
jgi:hypothetical protein